MTAKEISYNGKSRKSSDKDRKGYEALRCDINNLEPDVQDSLSTCNSETEMLVHSPTMMLVDSMEACSQVNPLLLKLFKISATNFSVENLLHLPPPENTEILCRMIRAKQGLLNKIVYVLLEVNGERVFCLAARKRKKSKSPCYVISVDKDHLFRGSRFHVGTLRSNLKRRLYCLYGRNKHSSSEKVTENQLATIDYQRKNFGPKRMRVLLPAISTKKGRIQKTPGNTGTSLLQAYKNRQLKDLIVYHNKTPIWDAERDTFTLHFNIDRCSKPSTKNFQITSLDDKKNMILQFGRIGPDAFCLDFKYPFSILQAFGIALSILD